MSTDMKSANYKALKKLSLLEEQIKKTGRDLTKVSSIRMLSELIKEQMPNENTRNSVSQTR